MRWYQAAAGALFAAAPVSADKSAWYAGVEGGLEFNGHFMSDADTGYAFLAAVGRRLGTNFSVEGDIGYRTVTQPAFFYDVDQLTVTVNGVYDVELTENLSLALAGGVGVNFVRAKGFFFGSFNNGDVMLATQFRAGLNYALSDTTDITLNYRNVQSFGNDFADLGSTSLTVGLRFDL
jgi:opacity protein-like surface antigen